MEIESTMDDYGIAVGMCEIPVYVPVYQPIQMYGRS